MKTITIDVTQEDIDKGVCGDVLSCAIARAFSRITDGLLCFVKNYSVSLPFPSDVIRTEIPLPLKAVDFIDTFDGRKIHIKNRFNTKSRVKPFSFQLDMSDELYAQLFVPTTVMPTTNKLDETSPYVLPTPVGDKQQSCVLETV